MVNVSKPRPKVIGYTILIWDPQMTGGIGVRGSSIIKRNPMGLRPIVSSFQALPLTLCVYAG